LLRCCLLALALVLAGSSPSSWSAADRRRLQDDLDRIFSAPAFAGAGLVVVDAGGEPIFARNPSTPLAPASTQKVITAAVALERLGPAYRAQTRFLALAAPSDGVLAGPLWLAGGGDPYLSRDDLRNGVAELSRLGVREIDGPLILDDSRFEGPEINGRWAGGDVDGGFAAPLSALSLDQGTIEVHVTPSVPGSRANVTLLPKSGFVRIASEPVTDAAARTNVDFVRLKDPASPGTPNVFSITGSVGDSAPEKLWIPVLDTRRYVASVVAIMLHERGIALMGPVTFGAAPLAGVALWTHRSPPLSKMLAETLTHSNNHAADQLLRLIGTTEGFPGSDERGLAIVRSSLEACGADAQSLQLQDGSGLSPQNRATALAIAQTIACALSKPSGGAFLAALPLVGKEGTVKDRQVQTSLGRARAKTGHLTGVDALAGTVLTRTHGRVAFAFIANGPAAWGGDVETAQDDALDVLAGL
jgi:D-alanyl-D-alanine carboxypeptidase/D-alanyl-D-alanine-endopeptidase (penicillin-binding protein 4)